MSGVIPSTAFNDQIKRVVRQVLREERGVVRNGQAERFPGLRWQWAIATTAISAASNGLTTPGTGTVELLTMNFSNRNLETAGVQYAVTNRFESISIDQDTLCIIARFKGEWVVMAADCEGLASPPS